MIQNLIILIKILIVLNYCDNHGDSELIRILESYLYFSFDDGYDFNINIIKLLIDNNAKIIISEPTKNRIIDLYIELESYQDELLLYNIKISKILLHL